MQHFIKDNTQVLRLISVLLQRIYILNVKRSRNATENINWILYVGYLGLAVLLTAVHLSLLSLYCGKQ